jgi:hypothetical protein
MVTEFVAEFARLIATYPDEIRIESTTSGDLVEIVLFANQVDVGKLIGQEGKMIGAIKTVISGCKAKDGKSYRINVEPIR